MIINEAGLYLNKKSIMEHIQPYEDSHEVDKYKINDWHVWPLLRMIACMGYLTERKGRSLRFSWLRKTLAYRVYRWLNRHRIRLFLDNVHDDPYDANRDVAIITLSERGVSLDGVLYNIYSDPLVDLLNEQGISALVWETGKERFPRYSKSSWISRRMSEECNQLSSVNNTQNEPDWFADYQKLLCDIRGKIISWSEIKYLIDEVSKQATVFERWLKKTGVQYLFVVCWYNPFIMAAIMAARRCGVKTIELQHGTEGKLHYGYSNWQKVPENGYEVVPDVFWCWGENSAVEKNELNPAFLSKSSVIAGGNLWLNKWRHERLHSAKSYSDLTSESNTRRILVSLQEDVPQLLIGAISDSPHTWSWLIRYHPSWKGEKRNKYDNLFQNISHPGVDLLKPNKLLLYELLCETDVHITGFSTCALEALAFGVPSIIIDEVGAITYGEFIKQGLMVVADTSTKIIIEVGRAQRVDAENTPAITKVFASNDDASKALRIIINKNIVKI